jgi:uncharacterized phage protein (TIGR01671 family)
MREIKFRAWDKSINKMCGDFLYFVEDAIYQHHGNPWHDTRFFPMQYTGLKDRNGKEIYEGDILRWGNLDESTGENQIHAVKWANGGWVLGDMDWLYVQADEGEVIGNIYENPELLK